MSYFTIVDGKLIKTYCTESQLTETVNDLIYSADHPVYSINYRGHNIPDDLLFHAIMIVLCKMNKTQLDIFIKRLLKLHGVTYNRILKYSSMNLVEFYQTLPSEEILKDFLKLALYFWPMSLENYVHEKIRYDRVYDSIFTNAILSFSKLNKD